MRSDQNKKEIPCPVCASEERKVLYEPWAEEPDPIRLYGAASGVRGTQRLVRCASCAMIYESPRYPDEVILGGYESSDEAGHDSQYAMRVGSFLKALRSLSDRLPPPGARVLDVGTAGGAFLEAAEAYGYEAFGLEPSRFLVERGTQRGLRIAQGTVDSIPFPRGHFDLVCLWDVIEHVTDPARALRNLTPHLKPGGILLINFPDIGTPLARLAGRRFWWILSVHLHHFSRRTLARLCDNQGLEVTSFRPYWQTLELSYLQEMAIRLKVPLSRPLTRLTPGLLGRLPIPYYASQTTALARRKS